MHTQRTFHRHAIALLLCLGGVLAIAPVARAGDHTPPEAPRDLTVDGGEGWRTTNAFTVRWTNPPNQQSPIYKAHWKICRANNPDKCRTGNQHRRRLHRMDLHVFDQGDFTLVVWLEDRRGNGTPKNASQPVHLRYSKHPPSTKSAAAGEALGAR